jgi:2,3-bisphosphoglycerate-independent phosphoglycerate mutase
MKKYVVIIMDGAADRSRIGGRSPLQLARTPHIDYLTYLGAAGRMITLYDDLHKGSIVAILGMLGYEPHTYYPHGRASCEARAIGIRLEPGDIAFRANLSYMKGDLLDSYNAGYIKSVHALPLLQMVDRELKADFPNFELHHNSDFRNTLVVRRANVHPAELLCPEPHENMGNELPLSRLIHGTTPSAEALAQQLNAYVVRAGQLLDGQLANAILPWSASSALKLPPFLDSFPVDGKQALICHMDFLHGIALEAGIEPFKIGNGNWNTDYSAKGAKVIELLQNGYSFVCCHINAPDEASHMGDLERKVYSIEQIDSHVVAPVMKYFETHKDELGAVAITVDHFTNHFPRKDDVRRSETHSKDPVPFAIWNDVDRDSTTLFSEEDVVCGRWADPVNHTELLGLLLGGR